MHVSSFPPPSAGIPVRHLQKNPDLLHQPLLLLPICPNINQYLPSWSRSDNVILLIMADPILIHCLSELSRTGNRSTWLASCIPRWLMHSSTEIRGNQPYEVLSRKPSFRPISKWPLVRLADSSSPYQGCKHCKRYSANGLQTYMTAIQPVSHLYSSRISLSRNRVQKRYTKL